MASTQETGIIKSDGIGRIRYSPAYKDEVVAAYRQSGMSAAAFAKHCGVKYPTFVSWVAKGKTGSSPRGDDEGGQRFILAQIGGRQAEVPLKVMLYEVGNGSDNPRATTYTYYEDEGNFYIHGRIKSIENADGSWEYHEYSDSASTPVPTETIYRSWNDVAIADRTSALKEVREIEANKVTITRSVGSTQIAKEEWLTMTETDGTVIRTVRKWDGTAWHEEVSGYHPESAVALLAGRIMWRELADGTAETWSYTGTVSAPVITHRRGAGNRSGITKGTETQETYNRTGHEVAHMESEFDGATQIALGYWIGTVPDNSGRPTRFEYNGNSADYRDVQLDETPIRCLDPGAGKAAQGYLWTYHHPEHGVLFDWHNSRGADCLKDVLLADSNNAAFAGHLQSDGYSAYRAFLARHPDLNIQPVSCLAHIRRKFIEARDDQPRLSAWVLIQIAKIYELEARLRKRGASPELRRRARRRWSLRRYHHLIRLTKHLILRRRITPRSPLGKALHYAHDQWPQLQACFQHGHIDFDNNSVENAIRPTKLGAKNWMFVGGKDTGWRSAVIYTFVEQVRAQRAEPFRYLEWLFTELMHHPHPTGAQLDALMPAAWLQLHSSSCKIA